MNAVLGQSSLALSKLPKESPAVNNILNSIKAGERVANLTKQLLAYSGRGRFDIDEIDLNKLVKENVVMLEVSIPKTTQLRYDLGSPAPHIMGDIGQIQQVIMNLIINAGEAMGSNPGYITIRTDRIEVNQDNYEYSKYTAAPITAGRYATLQVIDNGSGISEETLARIFDPFFTTKFAGRGLGLAAVLGIIKGHKGGLRIDSEAGKGTKFEIVLPLIEASKISAYTQKNEIAVNGEGKTILVIDDETTILEFVDEVLSGANFKVISAVDPMKGIEIYRQHHQTISLVILDYSMPHMDGLAAFHELVNINKEVRVLICSGYSEEETLLNFGIDRPFGFLQKPYRPKTMVERVAGIISVFH
jgi:CheY-like chemotaxis protein